MALPVWLLYMHVFIFAYLILSCPVYASVWSATHDWDSSYENKFTEFVSSSEVYPAIFSDKNSNYYGIKTDCADLMLSLRIIFAQKESLPIKFKTGNGRIFSNDMTDFDHFKNDIDRTREFIHAVGDEIGTVDLSELNSYPVGLENVRAGDFYSVQYLNQLNELSHHVYVVKGFADNGDIILYSSTTPKAVRPLLQRIGRPTRVINGEPFGLRRLKNFRSDPAQYDFSQYEELKIGEAAYFKKLKESHQKTPDNLMINIEHRFFNICEGVKTREKIIQMTIDYKLENKIDRFFGESYDLFSTKNRDNSIYVDIQNLVYGYQNIVKNNNINEITKEQKLALSYLAFGDKDGLFELNSICKIELKSNISMSLRSFYIRFKEGLISSDPNDSYRYRWGIR